jgi:hypothetical protein
VQSEAYVIAIAKTTANNARNVVRTSMLVGYILSLTIPIYARLRLPSTFVLQPLNPLALSMRTPGDSPSANLASHK